MAYDKKTFLKDVVILIDTREQKNQHILREFERLGVCYRDHKLDYGDYSFQIGGRDFSLSCAVERKGSIDELYGNVTKDRNRIEKEFYAASSMNTDFTLLVEGCKSLEEMKQYEVPEWEMSRLNRKEKEIGKICYATVYSWMSGNRYQFHTVFIENTSESAAKILEIFYWYWHNYKRLIASRRNRGC
jgi:ERCC4-type nuclease